MNTRGGAVAADYLVLKDGVVEEERRVDARGTQVFEFGADRSRRLLDWKPAWEAGFRPGFDKDPLDGGKPF